jgi:hypothetical protein
VNACKSGKKRYRDERTALFVLVGLRARHVLRSDNRRQEQHAYRCPFCLGWHLTSQAPKGAA